MRIPIPIVLCCCALAVSLTWWLGTRDKDFLTPPGDLPKPQIGTHAPQPEPAAPAPDPGNAPATTGPETATVSLDTFADQAAMGTSHLRGLAENLQNAHWPHLAWLAWERILESENAPESDLQSARSAILQLRKNPLANQRVVFPDKPWKVTLHAGTAEKQAGNIETILQACASTIRSTAHPILEVGVEVSRGANPADSDSPVPVAVWISGPESGSRSSEVLSFTLTPDQDASRKTQATVSHLLRNLVSKSLHTPPKPTPNASFEQELIECFTRRAWNQLGEFMNRPEEESPATAKPVIQAPR